MENGKRELGIFKPKVYGLKNNIELSVHPAWFFVMPNFKLKKFHGEFRKVAIASRYSLVYPTPLLRLIQKDGTGGILADDPDIGEIPHLFIFQVEWLSTKILEKSEITTKLGLSICPGCELDNRHLVDLPLAYPRMAVYHYGIGANAGVDWDIQYSEIIFLKTDLDLFFIPNEKTFLEHKLLLNYQIASKYTLSAGYKLSHGYYPFSRGEGRWDLFPLLDLAWHWSK